MKIRGSCYFHSPTHHPALATHPLMPHVHPHVLWGRSCCSFLAEWSRFPAASAPQALLQPHIFALRHNTWGREPVRLQHCQEREGRFAQSWGDASWNLCSASQDTFSACVKDGSSWETYGIWFAEKMVVQPESVHRAASRLINNPTPCKEHAKQKATGIKFSYRNQVF